MNRTTALDALLLTLGRVAFVGFWFIAVLLVYRGLGKSPQGLAEAGAFAFSIALAKMVGGIVSDPLDLAVMRNAPQLLLTAPERAFDILRASFALRLPTALVIAGLLLALSPLAGLVMAEDGVAAPYLRLAAMAVVGDALVRALMSIMQVQARFRVFLLLEGMTSVLRFLAVVALWASGAIRVDLVLACYAAASFAAAAVGSFLLPAGFLRCRGIRRRDLVEILNYLKWIMPAMLLAAVNERLDVLFVYTFAGAAAAGLYGAALALALIPDILAGCLSTLIQPRIASLYASGDYDVWLRRFLGVSFAVCGLGYGLSLIVAEPFFALALGPKYVEAAPAFHWLLAGTLFWLAVTPLPMTLVAVLAPQRVVLVTLAQSAFVLIGGLLLVPRYGWIGMAQTIFAMRVAVALLLVVAARRIPAGGPAVRPVVPDGSLTT
jgi:O-antigen/teichoic acid export membrane protein